MNLINMCMPLRDNTKDFTSDVSIETADHFEL